MPATDRPRNAELNSELLPSKTPWQKGQIDEALDKLAVVEPDLAESSRFVCGFSFADISAMRNVSERTVQRRWEKARIYLHRELRAELSL